MTVSFAQVQHHDHAPGNTTWSMPAALLAATAMIAMACSTTAPAPPPEAAPVPSRTERAPPGTGNAQAVVRARIDTVRYRHTAADVHFMSAMIGHHAQAIVMSQMAPTRSATPSVRTLAERIVNGQEDEIATAERWLRDRGLPVPQRQVGGTGTAAGTAHHHAMAGMITEAELKQLERSTGKEFDRLFLTLMIKHHRGAMTMVNELFNSHGAGQDQTVFKFASDINVDQGTEIARMEQMLASLRTENSR